MQGHFQRTYTNASPSKYLQTLCELHSTKVVELHELDESLMTWSCLISEAHCRWQMLGVPHTLGLLPTPPQQSSECFAPGGPQPPHLALSGSDTLADSVTLTKPFSLLLFMAQFPQPLSHPTTTFFHLRLFVSLFVQHKFGHLVWCSLLSSMHVRKGWINVHRVVHKSFFWELGISRVKVTYTSVLL